MFLQICLESFEIVTYTTEFYGNDDSGVVECLKKAKKEILDTNIQKQFRQMRNVFLSHRRLGEAAALYRLIPDMHYSESNVTSVFVTTSLPESRYRFAKQVSENANDPRYAEDESVIEITDREGLYREATTLLNYYQMRDPKNNVDKKYHAQFCKEYDPSQKQSKNQGASDGEDSNSDEDVDAEPCSQNFNEDVSSEIKMCDRIHTPNDNEIYRHPNLIKLRSSKSGDAPLMKRKKCQMLSDFIR